jgi:hypothetical protein
VDSSGRVLTWTHRLEYTDTGTYVCLVREPATERLSSATVNLTVLREYSYTTCISPSNFSRQYIVHLLIHMLWVTLLGSLPLAKQSFVFACTSISFMLETLNEYVLVAERK